MATVTDTTTTQLPSVKLERTKNPDGSALYPEFLPFYDPLEKVEDLGNFDHYDAGKWIASVMPTCGHNVKQAIEKTNSSLLLKATELILSSRIC